MILVTGWAMRTGQTLWSHIIFDVPADEEEMNDSTLVEWALVMKRATYLHAMMMPSSLPLLAIRNLHNHILTLFNGRANASCCKLQYMQAGSKEE